jgi:hypothetical protein
MHLARHLLLGTLRRRAAFGRPANLQPPAKVMVSPFASLTLHARWFDTDLRGADEQRLRLAVPVMVVVSFLYVFLATAGTFAELPAQSDYYDQMAEGFRAGHLYLQEEPSKALLAKDNPYADKWARLGVWDASLYDGRYYFYWGPVPALLVLAFKAVSGMAGTVNDQWLGLLFMLGRFYGGAALILSLSRVRALSPPPWLAALSIAVFGLAGPSPFIVARPQVYEASLAAGQCFLVWGLWAAFHGLFREERRIRWLVLAGSLWALAMGSRATTWASVPVLVAITAGTAWLQSNGACTLRQRVAAFIRESLALGLPVAAAGVAYACYNYARFGAFTEFGVNYQISLQKFWTHESFIWPNVVSYLWAPLDWSCQFPFAKSTEFRAPPPLMQWPPGYQTFEKVSGVLVMAPWCYLVLLSVVRLLRGAWNVARARGLPRKPAISRVELWALLCSFAMLLGLAPALGLWEASMRYSGDALAGALIAAVLGAFWLLRRAEASRNRVLQWQARLLLAGLGAYTCFVGAFSGVSSYEETLLVYNPDLHRSIASALSLCGSPL